MSAAVIDLAAVRRARGLSPAGADAPPPRFRVGDRVHIKAPWDRAGTVVAVLGTGNVWVSTPDNRVAVPGCRLVLLDARGRRQRPADPRPAP